MGGLLRALFIQALHRQKQRGHYTVPVRGMWVQERIEGLEIANLYTTKPKQYRVLN